MNSSDTWSSVIKVPTITLLDRLKLLFTPLQIMEVDGMRVYYKCDAKNKLYIYDMYKKKPHYAFDMQRSFPFDLPVWAICKYCGTKIGSPTHYCPRYGKDIDRQYAGEK